MNKAEAKKTIESIIERVAQIRNDVDSLKHSSYDACYEIAPYEGWEWLTKEQKELVKWFQDLNDKAFDAYIALDGVYGLFNDIAD